MAIDALALQLALRCQPHHLHVRHGVQEGGGESSTCIRSGEHTRENSKWTQHEAPRSLVSALKATARSTTILLAGAGIKGGLVHGATDRYAEFVTRDPVAPEDITATILLDESRSVNIVGKIRLRL